MFFIPFVLQSVQAYLSQKSATHFCVTIDFFALLELFQCQVPKELSKASTLPFTRGKMHEGTCPVGRKINPDFPVPKVSFYSSIVVVIKPGYISNIQHITENVKCF